MHQLVKESAHVLIVANDTKRLARACRDAGGAREQHEFFPDVEKDMIAQRDVDVRILNLLYVAGEDRIRTPIKAATADSGICTGVADHPRSRDGRGNIGCPADYGLFSEDRHESLDAVDAVLKSNHPGVGAYEWACLLTCCFGIPQ